MSRTYRFATCELHSDPLRLVVDGQCVDVASQSLLLLQFLLQRPGELVEKSILLQEVWGHHHLTDAAYARAIMRARQAVGDDGKSQQIIRTVHGRGVMLVASVVCEERQADPAAAAADVAVVQPGTPLRRPFATKPRRQAQMAVLLVTLALLSVPAWRWIGYRSMALDVTTGGERTLVLSNVAADETDLELVELQEALPAILSSVLQLDRVHVLGTSSDSSTAERSDWPGAHRALPAYFGASAALDLQLRREGLQVVIAYALGGVYATSAEVAATDRAGAVRELVVALREHLSGLGRRSHAAGRWMDDPLLTDLALRGHSAWARGEIQAAARSFDAALAMAPDQVLLQLWRLEIDASTSLPPAQASLQLQVLAEQHASLLTPLVRARVLERAGVHAWYAGNAPRAAEILDEAVRLLEDKDADFTMALVRNALSMAQQSAGMHELAWENGSLAVDSLRRGGHQYHLAFALSNLGYMAEERGRLEASASLQREALALRQQFGFTRQIGASMYAVARTTRRRGDLIQAQQLIDSAVRRFVSNDQRYNQIDALEERAEIQILLGHFEQAEASLDRAATIATELEDSVGAAWLQDVRARLRIAQGRAIEAVPLLQRSIAVQIEHGERHESEFTRIALADALDLSDQLEAASALRLELRQSQDALSHDQLLALSVVEMRAARRSEEAEAGLALCNASLPQARISGTVDREALIAIECARLHHQLGDAAAAQHMLVLASHWNSEFRELREAQAAVLTAPR